MNGKMLALGVAAAVLSADACTGLYVGKKASVDGTTMLCKTEDDWGMKFWHYGQVVPRRQDGGPGEVRGDFGFRRALPEHTFRYVTFPRSSQYRAPRLVAQALNEKGLVVNGAVTAWPNHEFLRLDPFVPTGTSWETMPDYLAATCVTAREAVESFARVIAEQGNFEGDNYFIADRNEAWYFEAYTGHHWAAVRMPEDCVAALGNQFMLGDIDLEADGVLHSPGLVEAIAKSGVGVKGPSGRYHLAASIGAPLDDFHNLRTWYGREFFAKSISERYEPRKRYDFFFRPDAKVSVADAIRFLRSRYEGTEWCPETNHKDFIKFVGSENQELQNVIQIRNDVAPEFSVASWTSFGPSEHSPFLPIPNQLNGFEKELATDCPKGAPEDYRDDYGAANRVRKLATLARLDHERYGQPIRRFWERLEAKWQAEWPALWTKAAREGDAAALSAYSRRCQRAFIAETQSLIDRLMNYMIVDVRTCWWHPAPDGYGIVPVPQNPPFEAEGEPSDAPRRRDAGAMSEGYRRLWNAEVQAAIDARIERHRKADAAADGFLPGSSVRVEQVTHGFRFGAHIFNFDQLGRKDWNDLYKSTFTNLLNAATVAYYWGSYEPVRGSFRHAAGPRDNAAFWDSVASLSPKEKYERFVEYRRPAPDPILDFCAANGIDVHGHAMIYRIAQPDWVAGAAPSDAEQIDLYRAHIRELAEHVGTRVSQWDVVNESVRRDAPVEAPDDTVFWGPNPPRPVPAGYTLACYDEAAKRLPKGVRATINEACVIDDVYLAFVKSLLDRGAKIDTVGLQFHIFNAKEMLGLAKGEHKGRRGYCYSPERILQTLAKADRLGRPIHISEITVPAPEESAWGEAVQAEALRDLYRLWFSWPSVNRITYWNLVDFTYHKESLSSGFYARDMRKKAVWHAMDKLLNEEWKTRVTVTADAAGRIAFRGFRGTYRLVGTGADGKRVERRIVVK